MLQRDQPGTGCDQNATALRLIPFIDSPRVASAATLGFET
jgi:hypothetical protein